MSHSRKIIQHSASAWSVVIKATSVAAESRPHCEYCSWLNSDDIKWVNQNLDMCEPDWAPGEFE